MGIVDTIEGALGRLLSSFKGHDDKLFSKRPAFSNFPEPTFDMHSSELGASGSSMNASFPPLEWSSPPADTKELILVVEDPDVPIPFAITHALFYSIPASVTSIQPSDARFKEGKESTKELAGPMKLGKNIRGTIFEAPRPPINHGAHRYIFQLVALSEALDYTKMSSPPSKAEIGDAVNEKITGWAQWIGMYERKPQ